ncbi:hypothetical protein [Pectobacterium brasiliense]|uniref:hypothetical protein n=1 Tax=Pectobacterium brasiliense TaxID=180957 RepID=UPI0015DF2E10|nr:hypothetical protein [Pectobacterium brasiliense]MBA0213498.1 hypothetical protein [Pectobacterium brasiliense]
MRLSDFCLSIYKQQDRVMYNGISPVPDEINRMIYLIYKNLKKGLRNKPLPNTWNEMISHPMSDKGEFNKDNFSDVIALVFDVITERHFSEKLWSENESINSEISHIFEVLINDEWGTLSSYSKELLSKPSTSYVEIKRVLISDLSENPYDLI